METRRPSKVYPNKDLFNLIKQNHLQRINQHKRFCQYMSQQRQNLKLGSFWG
jgi:hypothetical protein